MDHFYDLLISRGLKNWVSMHSMPGEKARQIKENLGQEAGSEVQAGAKLQYQPYLFPPRSTRILLRDTPNPSLMVFRDWSFHLAISMFSMA